MAVDQINISSAIIDTSYFTADIYLIVFADLITIHVVRHIAAAVFTA